MHRETVKLTCMCVYKILQKCYLRIVIYIITFSLKNPSFGIYYLLLLVLLLTAIEFSRGGSNPYTSTDNTNKNKCT